MRYSTGRTSLVLLALAAAALLAACTNSNAPAEVRAIVDKHCTRCHSASKAIDWRAPDQAAAQKLVNGMAGRGATLTDAEKAALVTYYTR